MWSTCIEGKVVTFYILFPVKSPLRFFLWFSWCSLENETETILQEKDVKESVTLLVDTVYLVSLLEWGQNWTYWVSGKRNWSTLNTYLKAKLSPKCNLGFFCECIWVKPLCKRIIMMREALLRFNIFLFLGQTHFQCVGDPGDSIKIHSSSSIFPKFDETGKIFHMLTPPTCLW